MSHQQDAAREYARNVGREHPERAWILTDYDTWEPNPFYAGPKVRHPEDDGDTDDAPAVASPASVKREPSRDIRITYSTLDHYRSTRHYKTLAGARKFAHRRLGDHPDLGSTYAVSFDGVVKLTVTGASLAELFPTLDSSAPADYPSIAECDAIMEADRRAERAAEQAEAEQEAARLREAYTVKRSPGCTCSDLQLIHVGCDCLACPF